MKFISIVMSAFVFAFSAPASNGDVNDGTLPGTPSQRWIDWLQPNALNSFHLPPEVLEMRSLLDEIATATGDRDEFMQHHAGDASRVPLYILRDGLTAGWLTGVLQRQPSYTRPATLYFQVENSVDDDCLHLEGERLAFLPPALKNLTQLRVLSLHDNYLMSVPDCIENLTQLVWLALHNNHLTSVPESIESLTQLRMLSLHSNLLTSVPQSLSTLTQLSVLSLHHNFLTSVPKSIKHLTQLRELALYENPLTVLPEDCVQLINLDNLYLSRSQWANLKTRRVCVALRAAQRALGRKQVAILLCDDDNPVERV